MKNKKHNQPRRAAPTTTEAAGLHERMETKLLRICADIGWICGLRDERMAQVPVARRSSRKRVMLGRALAVDVKMQVGEGFSPVESAFVSSGRIAYAQSEPAVEVSCFADIADDLQDELARLGRMGISASQVAGALGDGRMRSLGRQLWEHRQSML